LVNPDVEPSSLDALTADEAKASIWVGQVSLGHIGSGCGGGEELHDTHSTEEVFPLRFATVTVSSTSPGRSFTNLFETTGALDGHFQRPPWPLQPSPLPFETKGR